eukprot:Nk52_evm20s914 gene=Nk52_evmTU20s914
MSSAHTLELTDLQLMIRKGKNLISPRIAVFTKKDCSLCVVAKDALNAFKAKRPDLPFEVEEVDISREENKKWFDLYQFDIPVMHLDGKHFMKHRVDDEKLKHALETLKSKSNKTK